MIRKTGARPQKLEEDGVRLLLREEPRHHWAHPELVRGQGEVPSGGKYSVLLRLTAPHTPDQVLTPGGQTPHVLRRLIEAQPGAGRRAPGGEGGGGGELSGDM